MADEGEAVVNALQIDDPVQQSLLLAMLRNDVISVRAIVDSGFKFDQQPQVLSTTILGMPVPSPGLGQDDPFRPVYLEYVAIGELNMIELMIEAGADMDCMTSSGEGALQLAARIEDREVRWRMIKLLLDAGVSPVNERNKYRSTSVHEAVSVQDIELVRFLVNAGAELNCLDRLGMRSPLHIAVLSAIRDESSFELIKQLVEAGANVNITTEDGSTVLHYVCQYQDQSQREHTWKLIKLLLDLGADLNVVNNDKISPLAMMAGEDHYEAVEKMIQAGADVNISKQCTGSPFQLAVSRNNLAIVELLLQNGADVHVKDENGNNILYYATELNVHRPTCSRNVNDFILGQLKPSENLDILKKIVALGVPLDCPEYLRFKPLASAISSGTMETMNFFLEKGINLESSGVKFPLHLAAGNRCQEIMKYLLNQRLYDVNERNDSGLTPLYIAAGNKQFYSVIQLVCSGADINLSCQEIDRSDPSKNCQRTPLGVAMITGPLMALSGDHPSWVFSNLGDFRLVDFFLNLGANMFTPDVYEVCKILVKLHRHNFERDNNDDDDSYLEPDHIYGTHDYSAMMIAPLIGQIALLKDQNRSIDADYENYFVQNMPKFSELMQRCSNQLQLLKAVKLFESVTLYDLLIGKDVTRFVKNEQVVALMNSKKIQETSKIYAYRLRDSFSIAKAKRQAMDDAKGVLNKLLRSHFDQWPMILDSILTQLDFQDLQNLHKLNL